MGLPTPNILQVVAISMVLMNMLPINVMEKAIHVMVGIAEEVANSNK